MPRFIELRETDIERANHGKNNDGKDNYLGAGIDLTDQLAGEFPEKNLGVITARGGSKGIPRKNIALLGGRPLLAYTADAARGARLLNRVVLSTEDEEIAEIMKTSVGTVRSRIHRGRKQLRRHLMKNSPGAYRSYCDEL